jgi:hypothetical protein
VVSRSLRALRHDAGAGLSSGRLAKLAMTHARSFPQSQLATLATAATLPALSPRPSQVSRLSQGRIGIVRPARPELSQTSRVSQRHLPEQRSARSPRQMAPQRGLPALAGLAPFVDPCPGFRPRHRPRYEPVRPLFRGARDEGCRARLDGGGVVGSASCGRRRSRRLFRRPHALQRRAGARGRGRSDPLHRTAPLGLHEGQSSINTTEGTAARAASDQVASYPAAAR